MNALQRLLETTRPFKPFTFTFEGEDVSLYARRASAAEMAAISAAWDKAYQESKANFQDTEAARTALYANLDRLQPERLQKFIADAERLDLEQEASMLCDDKPVSDPEVKEAYEELRTSRLDQLKGEPHEVLMRLAMDRRAHFTAIGAATVAMNHALVLAILYQDEIDTTQHLPTGSKLPLFTTAEEVMKVPAGVLDDLLRKALDAITPPQEAADSPSDPLASPASP